MILTRIALKHVLRVIFRGPTLIGPADSCARCGARHTARQRCVNEGVLAEASSFAPSGADFAELASSPRTEPPAVGRPRHSALRATAAVIGGAIGTLVIVICMAVAGTYIARLTEADAEVSTALAAIVIAVTVGTVFGGGLLYVSARVYAKVVFSLLALCLVTAGSLMLMIAPALREIDSPDLASDRAFTTLIGFGAIGLAFGLALAARCLRWATRPLAQRRLAGWARALGSAYGVLLGISGLFGIASLLLLIGSNDGQTSVADQAIAATAVAMFSLVPGVILTYHGISASMGEPSARWQPPIAVFVLAGYAAVLFWGGINMAAIQPIAAPMPVLHALAAALPGVGLVALAARGSLISGRAETGLTWRQVVLAAAISMAVATWIAIYVEGIGSFGAVVLLLTHSGAFEGARTADDFWRVVGDSDFILSRNEQFFANLVTAALVAPIIEEGAKSLGARFMMRPTTTRSEAFVLGAAAGAGFGFLEAMLYGVAAVNQAGPGVWWSIMLVRGGSTSLHVLNTGLVALAWWYWSFGGRRRRAWLLFSLAVCLHALWNAFAVVLDSRIFGLNTLSDHAITAVAYVSVGVLAAAFIVAIPLIARRLREPTPVLSEAPAMVAI